MALPTSLGEYEDLYTLTPADQEFVGVHRTSANRLGVAVQLCFLRHPGRAWTPEETLPAAMLQFIAQQVGAEPLDLLDIMPSAIRPAASTRLKSCASTASRRSASGTIELYRLG